MMISSRSLASSLLQRKSSVVRVEASSSATSGCRSKTRKTLSGAICSDTPAALAAAFAWARLRRSTLAPLAAIAFNPCQETVCGNPQIVSLHPPIAHCHNRYELTTTDTCYDCGCEVEISQ